MLPGHGRSRGAMIAMFLAATFGMMALLSVPLSVPPLDRIFAPPVVQVPSGPEAAGPALPLPSWGHPQVAAAPGLPAQAPAQSAGSVTGSRPGTSETPAPPAIEPAPRLVMLRRLAGEIADSASPRLKALIRTGRVEGRDILRRTAIRLLHEHSPKDARGAVARSRIVTRTVGHGFGHSEGLAHDHDHRGRHHTHWHQNTHGHGRGSCDATSHRPGHDAR